MEINQLNFCRLLDPDNFKFFKNKFPEETFNDLKTKYGTIFEFDGFRNELNCWYSSSQWEHERLWGYKILS